MIAYANLHLAFEQMRIKARRAHKCSPDSGTLTDAEKQPPRILIIGPENSGKTTVCKILANYATRTGQRWSPMLVNLDPNEVTKSDYFLVPTQILISFIRARGRFPVPYLPLH